MKLTDAIYEMRRQPVITIVSITGTALAIFLIMIIVMMNEVKTAPFAPESNRDRWLVNKFMSLEHVDEFGSANGGMSYETARETYLRMRTPEEVTVFMCYNSRGTLTTPGRNPLNVDMLPTDHRFWRVMDFTFVDGHPYDEAQFEAGSPVVVINESVARKLFGTEKAAGREIEIDHVRYRVCGVVEDVSRLATLAYAEAWVPFTSVELSNWNDDVMGSLSAVILARDKSDFPEIRKEFLNLHRAYFNSLKDSRWRYVNRQRPYDQETNAYTQWANIDPDMESVHRVGYTVYAILLLIPAINLSSMTHSRLTRQRHTIGVKRAFGATRLNIMMSLLTENFLITLAAGAVGVILSLVFACLASDTIFSGDVTAPMLLQWHTFAWALLFCFLLNLISAGIPSFIASRESIVKDLSAK